jgi:hypothetical protein
MVLIIVVVVILNKEKLGQRTFLGCWRLVVNFGQSLEIDVVIWWFTM